MIRREPHQCECEECQTTSNGHIKKQHQNLNLLLSRLNEDQRRWLVALESKQIGHGGDVELSRITGMDEKTIRRGRGELDNGLAESPVGRIRAPGAGRPRLEKKQKTYLKSSVS